MSEKKNPTLQDVWRLLGVMNKRFDTLEHQMVVQATALGALEARLEARMSAGFGALMATIGSPRLPAR